MWKEPEQPLSKLNAITVKQRIRAPLVFFAKIIALQSLHSGGRSRPLRCTPKSPSSSSGGELDLDEFGLFYLDGAEDCHVGEGAFDHGDFVAGVEAGAGLAVFVDFVGHCVALGDAEAEVLEEVGETGEEAGGGYAVVFGLG